LPHSAISGSLRVCRSPELIAAYHGLHRLRVPRHPPHAFTRLTTTICDQAEQRYDPGSTNQLTTASSYSCEHSFAIPPQCGTGELSYHRVTIHKRNRKSLNKDSQIRDLPITSIVKQRRRSRFRGWCPRNARHRSRRKSNLGIGCTRPATYGSFSRWA
jgi:hypothetical protein